MSHAIERILRQGGFRGSALVRRGPVTLFEDADAPDTAYQIASVSKQLAAGAILLLQDRGILAVGDPVGRWIPGCPPAWDAMTIHHLLTHTSGIGHHWDDFPEVELYRPVDPLPAILARPLEFIPGSGWRYSSPGYTLLAHIVERAAAAPYSRVLERLVFAPLGMASTWAGERGPSGVRRATGHVDGVPTPPFNLDGACRGAGDIWSTPGDLGRWNDAILGGPLSALLAPRATTNWSFADLADARYGYGWCLATWRGRALAFHLGDTAGYAAINALLPDDGTEIVLLADDELDLLPLAVRIAAL